VNEIIVRFDALPHPFTVDACKRCGLETGYLVRLVKTTGRVALRLCCENCEKTDSTLDLDRDQFGIRDLTTLPTINQQIYDFPGNCAVCDGEADDWHHWGPRAIFPDWPDDHSVPICKGCHDAWHLRMRERGLRL
jgi:hypothetical protein